MMSLVPPLLIGAAAGFLALFMRELGLVLAAAVIVTLAAIYVGRRRYRSIAWLLMGAAVSWLFLLGPIAFAGLVDPQGSATVPETYLGVMAALFLAGFAVVMLVVVPADGERQVRRMHAPDPRAMDGEN
jgi:4-hydroxybenzoate polyprenyltransferase